MRGTAESPIVINGWKIYSHLLFLEQVTKLRDEVRRLRQADPAGYIHKNPTKRLAAIARLIAVAIPQDPTDSGYRLGDALGKEYRHWFRARFFQQYRLFFRYSIKEKVIVLGWVNDPATKRAYGSKTDAYTYKVFRQLLETGKLPDSWKELRAEAQKNTARLRKIIDEIDR